MGGQGYYKAYDDSEETEGTEDGQESEVRA